MTPTYGMQNTLLLTIMIMLSQSVMLVSLCVVISKASALWANAFYKSKCPSVCPSLHPSLKLQQQKNLADFALQNKVETTLPNGSATSGQRAYR